MLENTGIVAALERIAAALERTPAHLPERCRINLAGSEAVLAAMCQCTHEEGDSECPVHPRCGECGEPPDDCGCCPSRYAVDGGPVQCNLPRGHDGDHRHEGVKVSAWWIDEASHSIATVASTCPLTAAWDHGLEPCGPDCDLHDAPMRHALMTPTPRKALADAKKELLDAHRLLSEEGYATTDGVEQLSLKSRVANVLFDLDEARQDGGDHG